MRVDAGMADLAAQSGAGLILMHMLGIPKTMQRDPIYQDVVTEVRDFLIERADAARAAGVPAECIVLDPGIGFGKTLEHNLRLIRRLDALVELGYPVLLGASRKRFLGQITGQEVPSLRRWSSWGVHLLGAALGAHIVRVHEVEGLKEALMVSDAVMRAEEAA
jgi:dihydropteroate synthase